MSTRVKPSVAAQPSVPLAGPAPLTMWIAASAVFLAISRMHQYLTILAKLSAPAVLSVLALALLFADTERWRPGDLKRDWIFKGIMVIAVIAAVGFPFGIYPGNAFRFFLNAYSRTLLLALACWAIARAPGGARFLAQTLAVSGVATAMLALVIGRHDSAGRLSGAFTYDPNDFALICVVTVPFVLWWFVDQANRFRWAALSTLAPLLYAIMLTGSRSGFLGLAAVLLGSVVVGMRRGTPQPMKRLGRWVLVLSLAAVPVLPGDYVERIKSITSGEDYNETGEAGRIAIWKRGMGYAFHYPIFGVGLDNFATAEGRLSSMARDATRMRGVKWSAAHNSFVQLFAELGLIAGAVFIFLFLRIIATLLRWTRYRGRAPPEVEMLAPFVGLSFVGFVVDGFFLAFAYYDILYVMFALAAGLLLMVTARGSQPEPAHALPGRRAAAPAPRRRVAPRHGPVHTPVAGLQRPRASIRPRVAARAPATGPAIVLPPELERVALLVDSSGADRPVAARRATGGQSAGNGRGAGAQAEPENGAVLFDRPGWRLSETPAREGLLARWRRRLTSLLGH
jgi:O-antigen ligase